MAVSPAGDAAPPELPDPLETVIADCQAAGHADCDPTSYFTHDGAICVAKAHGLAEGLAEFKAGMRYKHEQQRVVWTVDNTTFDKGGGDKGGDSVVLDATSGALLAREGWSQIP